MHVCYDKFLETSHGEQKRQDDFVETPRKFLIAKLLISKLGSSSDSVIMPLTYTHTSLCDNKFTLMHISTKLYRDVFYGNFTSSRECVQRTIFYDKFFFVLFVCTSRQFPCIFFSDKCTYYKATILVKIMWTVSFLKTASDLLGNDLHFYCPPRFPLLNVNTQFS